MRFGNYHAVYGYPYRWAIPAQVFWVIEQRSRWSWAYRWRKRMERRGVIAKGGVW